MPPHCSFSAVPVAAAALVYICLHMLGLYAKALIVSVNMWEVTTFVYHPLFSVKLSSMLATEETRQRESRGKRRPLCF